MANQNTIADLSTTPASNLNFKGQSMRGTALANTIDSVFQNEASMLKAFYDSLGGVATVSGTDTYTVTITEDWAALASGLVLAIKPANANTGAATLNVTVPTAGALGAKAIRRQGDSALSANDMVANGVYLLRYSSTYNSSAGAWVLLNPASTTTFATAAQAKTGTSTTLAVNPAGLYLPTGHLFGLTLSNGTDATNDIDIAAGSARDSTDVVNIALASALTKQLDAAWAVGTNQGGLDTGSIANTTYHVWLIKRSDTGVVDALFSTSASSPTMPTNYDYKRRIGSIIRASASIRAFIQNGDDFLLKSPVLDVNATNPGTSAVLRTLSVPAGIKVKAFMNVAATGVTNTANGEVYISSPDVTDDAPSLTAAPIFTSGMETTGGNAGSQLGGQVISWTDTSSQVRTRNLNTNASLKLMIATLGWADQRGRLY